MRIPALVKLIKPLMDHTHVMGSIILLRIQLPLKILDMCPVLFRHGLDLFLVSTIHILKSGGELDDEGIMAGSVLGDGVVEAGGHRKDLFGEEAESVVLVGDSGVEKVDDRVLYRRRARCA